MPATLNHLEKDYLKLHKQVQEYISVLKVQSTSLYDGEMEIKPKKELKYVLTELIEKYNWIVDSDICKAYKKIEKATSI